MRMLEGVHSNLKEFDNPIQKEIRENPTETLVHDLEEKFQEHSEEISTLQEDIRKANELIKGVKKVILSNKDRHIIISVYKWNRR